MWPRKHVQLKDDVSHHGCLTSLSSCRWIFLVQICPLELHCVPDQWVRCMPSCKIRTILIYSHGCFHSSIDSAFVFPLLVYGVEVLLKISGLGPMAYFSSGWNLWVLLIRVMGNCTTLNIWLHESLTDSSVILMLCVCSVNPSLCLSAQVWLLGDGLCLPGPDRPCLQHGAVLFYRSPPTSSAAPVRLGVRVRIVFVPKGRCQIAPWD